MSFTEYDVREDAIDDLARALYAARYPSGSYGRLSFWQQSWFYDYTRTLLQSQGLVVETHAHWQCPPPPARLPGDSLDELRARLHAAKLALPALPADFAELIVHADGVLNDPQIDVHCDCSCPCGGVL